MWWQVDSVGCTKVYTICIQNMASEIYEVHGSVLGATSPAPPKGVLNSSKYLPFLWQEIALTL
jgi:hypothetical protein